MRRLVSGTCAAALAAFAVAACGLVAGCSPDAPDAPDSLSSSPGSPSPGLAAGASAFAADPADIGDADVIAAEERRLQEEREAAWRARFSTDDYSDTLIIGDSLMQNATASLRAAMPGVTVNADANRTLETGGLVIDGESPDAGVLDQVRNDGGSFARYVVETGNNDGGGLPVEAAEEIVERLGPEKEIYFVTMCSLLSPGATDATNQTIDAMVERYGNVHEIDWNGFVSGREHDYLSDGVHVYRDREPDYAAFIKEGLDVVY